VTPPPADDAEALFAEGHGHRRQRRLRLAAYALVLLVLGVSGYAIIGHGTGPVTGGRGGAAANAVETVVLLVDVSGSMRATDVKPTRLDAAVVAMHRLVEGLPEDVRVGVVSFSNEAKVVQAPTRDRGRVRAALGSLEPEAGTALGLGLAAATKLTVATLGRDGIGRGPSGYLPAAIVLASDGAQNHGATTPQQGAAAAKAAGIRVYGVALGKPNGTLRFGYRLSVKRIPVPPDARTVRSIASLTGGTSYIAHDAARLRAIYRQLAATLGR
jgi:Ca-activated chloride channel homolog